MTNKNKIPQNTDNTTSTPTQPTRLDCSFGFHEIMCRPIASEEFVFEIDPAAMEQIAQVMATINQRISGFFTNQRSLDLFKKSQDLFIGFELQQNPLNKCQDCVWLHKPTNFCAVAPKNLTSLECGDRQVPKPPENLDYLDTRSPERIALIQDLAQKLDMEPEMLEQKLFQGYFNTSDRTTTSRVLSELETIGYYSIAQMELIRDGIKVKANAVLYTVQTVVNAIRQKILAGYKFDEIMCWLLCVGYF